MEVVASKKQWFEEWFDSLYYHTLYQHRDEEEAYQFINHLLYSLQPLAGSRMLDLGCGAGRHSLHLAQYGFKVTGIDLSGNSIDTAKKYSSSNLSFQRADMRRPFGLHDYHYIFSFFTSLGYFNKEDNARVVANISKALKPGGTLVIDYLNVHTTLKNLVPFEPVKKDGIHFFIKRWSDENFVYKTIHVSDLQNNTEQVFTERVSLFQLKDFIKMFMPFGIEFSHAYGDYELNEFSFQKSKRLIMIFKKTL